MYLELCPVSCVRRRLATVVLAKKRNILFLEFTPSIRITFIPVDEASNVGPGAFFTRNPQIRRASVKYDFKRLDEKNVDFTEKIILKLFFSQIVLSTYLRRGPDGYNSKVLCVHVV